LPTLIGLEQVALPGDGLRGSSGVGRQPLLSLVLNGVLQLFNSRRVTDDTRRHFAFSLGRGLALSHPQWRLK
jgi:hypothetical protein